MTKRIAITGPESTGKSELAKRLADHYKTVWVPEYARDYLEKLKHPYTYDDIMLIAKGQVESENEMIPYAGQILFIDTEMIVLKIWCEVNYGKCHQWILNQLEKQQYDLYLLTNIDLPWQPDPLREHPDKRIELFELYLNELKKRNLPFEIISGYGEKRFLNAQKIIDKRGIMHQ